MLNDNIKTIRQNKGYKQEDLASRLHVTRQTISKWERGYSVPDAAMLQELAEVLEVSVEELLGAKVNPKEPEAMDEIVEQLSRLNEQLAIKNRRTRRIWKTIAIILIVIVVGGVGCTVLGTVAYHNDNQTEAGKVSMTFEVDGETYEYELIYNDNFQIISGGGDAYISDHTDVEDYDDVNRAVAHIEDYFDVHNGEITSKEVTGLDIAE